MPPDAFFCFFAVAVMVDVFSDLLTSAAVGPAIDQTIPVSAWF